MNSKHILALSLASLLASGVAHGVESDASHEAGAVTNLGFDLPVSALKNCLDLQRGSLALSATHEVPKGKYQISLDPGDAHYCSNPSYYGGCPVPKVTIYITSDENPRGWFNQVEDNKPIVLDVKGIGLEANRVYAFYTDIYCGDNSGGGVLKFTPAPDTYPLTVVKTGAGKVTSAPSGIDCGEDCKEELPSGTSVVLTATPESGNVFTGWGGACSGADSKCTVAMAAANNVTATFASGNVPPTPGAKVPGAPKIISTIAGVGTATLTFAAPASDGGSPILGYAASCAAPGKTTGVDTGLRSPLTVKGLTGGVVYSCTVIAKNKVGLSVPSAAVSVTPTAPTPDPVKMKLTVTTTGVGSVTSAPSGIDCGKTCSASYAKATKVTLTAVPGNNKKLTAWTGACTGSAATCVVTMDAAKTVGASFDNVVTAPGKPVLDSVTAGVNSAILKFVANAQNADGYIGTCTATGQATKTATGTGSPLTVTGMTAKVEYTCSLAAKNSVGTTVASKTFKVTPLAK